MTGDPQAGMDVASVTSVRIREGAAQSIFIRGNDDDVDMIGHEAITPDFSVGPLRRFTQQIFVKRIVAFFKERLRTPVTQLGDFW